MKTPQTEALRELAKRVKAQIPEGLCYILIVWPPGEPEDVGYCSNSHRIEAIKALETLQDGATRR